MAIYSDLENKVVIVTGASSGIGRQVAISFSENGSHVVLVGRNEENLREAESKCKSSGGNIKTLVLKADVTVESDVERVVSKTTETFGKLDVLVNNAGILENGSIENTSLNQYDTVMNTNVRAVYHLTMLCVPHLVKTKGCIVNISSVAGTRSFPNILAYSMSKATIDQFTRCIALELAPKQVRVNAVNPGVIITEVHKRGGMSETDYAAFLEKSKTTHALGRPGTADEVAASVTFLASSASSFITGATLPIDGGRHIMCPR